jgi:aminoglycoside/choline kinase family phosphotransferase
VKQGLVAEIKSMMDFLQKDEAEAIKFAEGSQILERLVRLPGDASTRQYYRVFVRGEGSYILMRMEPFDQEGMGLPFVVIRTHLEKSGIDVPQVLDIDPARGFLLLEDLGDVVLLRQLQDVATPEAERHLYERVIDSLVMMHYQASPKEGDTHLDAFRLRFDLEKLMWEVDFTFEHFYRNYLKREIPEHQMTRMLQSMTEICRTLADEPVVFTHRDFHSRNVMVKDDRFVMIDFQDARMGPAQYDLVSLLRDSYYQLEERQVESLIDYYILKLEATSGRKIDRVEFRRIFDLMTIQRNFKAIGSFASFYNRRNNPMYLKFIGNTFENVRRTLLRFPQYSELRELLFHWYYF